MSGFEVLEALFEVVPGLKEGLDTARAELEKRNARIAELEGLLRESQRLLNVNPLAQALLIRIDAALKGKL